MNPPADKPVDRILHDLQERAKELNCLYRVDELLGREEAPLDEVLGEVARTIPAGWQFPGVCVARIVLGNRVYEPPGFEPSPYKMSALIEAQGEIAGQIEIHYMEPMFARTRVCSSRRRGSSSTPSASASGTSSRGAGCCASSPSTAMQNRRPRNNRSCSTSCARPTARCSATSGAR
jgi:hypothetical protein